MKQLMRFVCLWSISTLLWADDARSFEVKFNQVKTMSAQFSQVVFSKRHAKHVSSGLMALHRPGQFRWETKEPMEQILVADGKYLWVYDVLLEQVTKRKQREIAGSSAALFLSTEEGEISKIYRVVATKKQQSIQYDLFSKSSHSDFKHVIFIFNKDQLVQLELFDTLGQRTKIVFEKVKVNMPLKPNLFTFVPPKGVDVVDEGSEARA